MQQQLNFLFGFLALTAACLTGCGDDAATHAPADLSGTGTSAHAPVAPPAAAPLLVATNIEQESAAPLETSLVIVEADAVDDPLVSESEEGDVAAEMNPEEEAADGVYAGVSGLYDDIPWTELNDIYNLKSTVSSVDKTERWQNYKGRRVEWTGTVRDISSEFGLVRLEVQVQPDSVLPELLLRVQKDSDPIANRLKKGGKVTFVGTLTEWSTVAPVLTLEEVTLVDPGVLALKAQQRKEQKAAAAKQAKFMAESSAAEETQQRRVKEDLEAVEAVRRQKRENAANSKLELARKAMATKPEVARKWFEEIREHYPETKAAKAAGVLLTQLDLE